MRKIINKIANFKLPAIGEEDILFEIWSNDWNGYMPVKLICYNDNLKLIVLIING
jgi:hypothetical protein